MSATEPEKVQRRSFISIVPKTAPKFKLVVKKKMDADKHQENTKQILLSTNATPIRCRGGAGYTCCFCVNQYPEPTDLKKHTIEDHDDETKSTFMKGVTLDDFVVKLDITDLQCKLCDVTLKNLEGVVDHLKVKHEKKIHTDVIKHIVPFEFGGEHLHCAICSQQFNNFKVLVEHMNVHYRNHVCEVCGSGFINRRTLRTHGYRHITGSFPCSICPKVFDTKVKKKEHERAVHVHRNKRNKCGYCGEKFTDYTKKNDHEVKAHGAKPVVLRCHACNKMFDNQRSLTVHSKNYHLMERKK